MVESPNTNEEQDDLPEKLAISEKCQETSKSSLRRFLNGAFRGRRHSGKETQQTHQVETKGPAKDIQDATIATEKPDKDEIVLEFGQMLLDLSVEDFLKIKPKRGFNIPFIVVTPPPEDNVAAFTV